MRGILGTATLVALAALVGATSVADARGARRWHPDRPFVINGSAVTQGEFESRWSAMVAVLAESSYGTALCGGVVIDERTVLTAAHCTYGPSGGTLAASSFDVVVGRRVANSTAGDRVSVSSVTRHPSFHRTTMRNDIAVLRLSRTPAVAVTPIPPTSAADEAWWGAGLGAATGTDLVGPWIAGWGAVNGSGSSFPTDLQEAKLPIASDAACASATAPGQGTDFDGASMVCAGVPGATTGSGVDACQGDSGGPLIVGDGAGSWRVVGLTSWGRDCGGPYYGVYTRVGRYATWIEPLRWSASATPPADTAPPTASPSTGGTPVTQPPSGGTAPGTSTPGGTAPAGTTPAPDATGPGADPATPGAVAAGAGPEGSTPSPTPGDGAVGPITIPAIADAGRPPSRPTMFRVTTRGRGWVRVAWRASTGDARPIRYRLLGRSGRRWTLLRTTTSTRLVLRVARGRTASVRVQAVDRRGRRSAPSGVLRARGR